jgi:DNA-directed RNA polymerase subunit RPC12/RpoP
MESVIDYIECPNCGHEAYNDFYYKTGEEYVNCQNCGYHYSATYKTDDEGNYVTKDGTDNYEFDNLIMETKELKNPYGAYRLKYYDSVGYECGSLENEQNYVELLVEVRELNNVEYFGINRFVNGEIVTMDVIDNGPKVDGAGFSVEDRVAE